MSFNPTGSLHDGLDACFRSAGSVGGHRHQLGANWSTQCDGRLLTSGFTRLTINDVIAANGARVPAYTATNAPSGRHRGRLGRPAVRRCHGVLRLLCAAHGSARAPPIHEGFSKAARAPFFVATGGRGALIATVDTAVVVPTRVTVVEYYHAGLNYYFMTSRDNEKALLDAAPAWSELARRSRCWPILNRPLVATRFFFDKVAKSGTRGSHFYTISSSDVAALTALNPTNAATPRKAAERRR